MSHALAPTPFERGERSPAELVAPPPQPVARRTKSRPPVPPEEARRRRAVLEQALANYQGSLHALGKALDVKIDRRWLTGARPVPERHMPRVEEAAAAEPLPEPPRLTRKPSGDPHRRSGLAWCPGCQRQVAESQMHVNEGGTLVALERCKACLSSARITNDRALVAANHGGTTSA